MLNEQLGDICQVELLTGKTQEWQVRRACKHVAQEPWLSSI